MKNISTQLAAHIAGETTTLATCWKLVRRDETVMGFTDHDADLTVGGVDYKAQTGFSPSAVQTTASLAVDNLDIDGMLDSGSITESDIMAGLYDFAEIEIFLVNYCDLTMGSLILRTGWLGQVSYSKNHFVAEVRGLTQALSQKIGSVYSPTCRAVFCDAKCGLDAADFTVGGTVTGVVSGREFIDSSLTNPAGYFGDGKVNFTSGANAGLQMEVKDFTNGAVTLVLQMPYAIAVGDTYEITAGCDKNFQTCISKFSNAVNFRGEPDVPGMDAILLTSGTIQS